MAQKRCLLHRTVWAAPPFAPLVGGRTKLLVPQFRLDLFGRRKKQGLESGASWTIRLFDYSTYLRLFWKKSKFYI
jgi:hypothetical protein